MMAITNEKIKKLLLIIVSLMFLFFFYLPIYEALKTSITDYYHLLETPPRILPRTIYLGEYVKILTNPNWQRYFLNSLIYASISTILTLFVGSIAAYALSRFEFRGKVQFMFGILTQDMISIGVAIASLAYIIIALNLYNTYGAIIIVQATANIPFSIWTLKGFFDQLPVEIEESALVDGCNRLQALVRIVLPLSAPGFLATGTFLFIGGWSGGFLLSIVFLSKTKLYPLVRAIYETWIPIHGPQPWQPYNLTMAASLLAALIPMILYLLTEKYLVKGIVRGALK